MLDAVYIHLANVIESGSGVGIQDGSLLVEMKLLLGLLLFNLLLLCLLLLLLGSLILLVYLGLLVGLLSLFGLGLALLLLCCCGYYAHKQCCHDDKNRLTYVSHCISTNIFYLTNP